jgi:membrane-bound lytic murein transglycosylase A
MNVRRWFVLAVLPVLVLCADGCRWGRKKPEAAKDYNRELGTGESALTEVDPHEMPDVVLGPDGRERVRRAIANSLDYFAKPSSQKGFPVAGVSKEQVIASLRELDQLLATTSSDSEFNAQLKTRFRALMSVGCDSQGTVLFTGYCTPIYDGSLKPDGRFRYPLYKRPADLIPGEGDNIATQKMPNGTSRIYPTRKELEDSGALRGLELVYLSDPFEAYVIQVQGSGKLRLTSGEMMEIGFDGTNNHPYYPIAKDMIADSRIRKDQLSLATMKAYFRAHPQDLETYTQRNPRFIFFAPSKRGIVGSLNVPVTTDVTIATDKSIFPRGAPCLVSTSLSGVGGTGNPYAALRVDQDAGGGIRAPGRCDLYMGVGEDAERRAGSQFAEGKMYYLIARDVTR